MGGGKGGIRRGNEICTYHGVFRVKIIKKW